MLQNQIYILMSEEFLATIEGIILLFIISRKIIPKIVNKKNQGSVLYLILGYLAILSTTFSRAVGIYLNNSELRLWGALVAGSIGIILFNIWGTIQIKMKRKTQKTIIFSTSIGLILFAIGAILNYELLKGIGLIIFAFISIITLLVLLNYVLTHSPYLKAQQKVKIITIGFTLMVIFEMTGVFLMQINQWLNSTILFLLRDLSWLIVTMGIIFPKRLQIVLAKRYYIPKPKKSNTQKATTAS